VSLVFSFKISISANGTAILSNVTSPAGAVAKYYDQHVCLCLSVCVSLCLSVHEDISRITRDIFTTFYACCLWPWLGPPPAK